jgi:predicted TIM-barrel fold metal-dependent hydrolase
VSEASLPIVDAHHHLWDLGRNRHPWLQDEPPIPFRYGDYRALRRDYLAGDYRRDSKAQNVVSTVYVEAEWDPRDPRGEVRWVEEVAAREGFPNAIVAQAWLDRADAAEVLAAHAARPLVRGVRHKPKAAPGPAEAARGAKGSMDDPLWRAGYALLEGHGLSFDLQTPWWHLDAAAVLARDFPGTTLILNHTGLPADRSREGLAGWRKALERLADAPNTAIKISGLGLAGRPWRVEDNAPIIRDAIRIFGPKRAMFASNYPVDGLVAPFATIFDGFRAATADLPEADRRRLFHDNARHYYRIGGDARHPA